MINNPLNFIFATGIENSYPTILSKEGTPKRVDEMEACGHYKNWRKDFELALQLGVTHLRWGPPYYKVHCSPGKYDWAFTDEVMAYLKELGLNPIVDLCHFGVPDWIGNFQNPDFPKYFAEYAMAFAKRYPWVHWFTPVNEIFITATFSAQYGWWNERETSDKAFVKAIKHLCQANTLAMHSILQVQPRAIFVQSESSEYYHPHAPDCMNYASFLNEKRFLALDLTYGHSIDCRVFEFLIDNGMTRSEYHWFRDNEVKAFCIMGTDFYASNEHLVQHDGSFVCAGEIFGYYVITSQYFQRYHIPVMHTETNVYDKDKAVHWLYKEWQNLFRLRKDGIPIVGFTWFSLTDQIDWDTHLRGDNGNVNNCGLYDLGRKITPVGEAYKELIENWRDLLPTGSIGLQIC